MRAARRSVLRIFLLPGLIALVTLAGLVAGLLGDGVPDALAWLGLAVPLLAIGSALGRARRRVG